VCVCVCVCVCVLLFYTWLTLPSMAICLQGVRVYTFFVYLSDVEEGGGTHVCLCVYCLYIRGGGLTLTPEPVIYICVCMCC